MRYLSLALLCCACGSPVGVGHIPPTESDASSKDASAEDSTQDVSAPKDTSPIDGTGNEAVMDATALKPCVDGSWYVRIIPAICQRCLLCQIYATPQAYTIQIGDTIPLLSCSATLSSVEGANKCTYQNMDKCTPVFNYGDGGSETFSWDGTITFQRFTGVIPIGVANGNILWELFNDVEIGRSDLVYGQDAGEPCPYMILMTKEVPQDGSAE